MIFAPYFARGGLVELRSSLYHLTIAPRRCRVRKGALFRVLLDLTVAGARTRVGLDELLRRAGVSLAPVPGVPDPESWSRALAAAVAARLPGAAQTLGLLGQSWAWDIAMGEIALALDSHPASDVSQIHKHFSDFAQNIGPKQIYHLKANLPLYAVRVRLFMERRGKSDDEIRDEAREIVPEQINGREQRFFNKIPSGRLRTYDVRLLRDVAGHFLDWDPIIEGMERNDSRIVEVADRTLRAALGVNSENENAWGDKVNEAWIRVKWDDPWSGYCYESPLDAWLVAVARKLAAGRRRAILAAGSHRDRELRRGRCGAGFARPQTDTGRGSDYAGAGRKMA